MIITLSGPNDLARRRALDALVADFITENGDMALERLDGEEATAQRMLESVQSLPFLSPRKLVVLREPGKQKDFAGMLEAFIAAADDTTDVVLYEPKFDKRSVYYKTLQKRSDFREFTELDAPALARWAADYAKSRGGTLPPAVASRLVQRIGTDQLRTKHELDKLLAYDPVITPQTIELLTDASLQSSVFELLEAAFSGNRRRAAALYQEQRAQKVDPHELISMFAWQLHILALVKAQGDTAPADVAARATGLKPFVVQKAQRLTRTLPMKTIKNLIGDLLALDLAVKRSSVDADEALQLYMLKLAEKRTTFSS